MRPLSSLVGEQMLDDRLAHRLRRAFGRPQVHQQPRAGIDLDDRAALFVQRLADVLGHHVDAGDVQADGARGQRHQVGDFRVHVVGAVDGDVAVALDQHTAAGGRHAVGRQAQALQVGAHHVVLVDLDAVEREVLGGAAARVGVELAVDQLAHRAVAVAA